MIIIKEFRRLIKEKVYFFIMLCAIQVVVAFGVLFLIGIIDNNINIMNQDYLTQRFSITITSDATYKDVEDIVKKIAQERINNISEVYLFKNYSTEVDGSEINIGISSYFGIKNNKYIKSDNDLRYEKALKSGMFYTEADMNAGVKSAVMWGLDKKVLEPLVIADEKVEIVGEIYSSELNSNYRMYVTPNCFENLSYFTIDFSSNTIISEKTCNRIIEQMDTVIPGQYQAGTIDEKRMDSKGLSLSIILACMFILVLVTFTIISIFSFWVKENNYRLGVWKLLGCRHGKAALIYTVQMILITVPSILIGSMIFVLVKNSFLLPIYPYMEYFYSYKIYMGISILIFVIIVGFVYLASFVNTKGKIRKILL